MIVREKNTIPVGVRLGEETKEKLSNISEKQNIPLSTCANNILTECLKVHKPMLDSGMIMWSIPLIKMSYNFFKESDFEVIASMISDEWHKTIRQQFKDPTFDDYVNSLEGWANSTHQRFTIFNNVPMKHIFDHEWGYNYSKITSILFRKVFESLGYRFEEIEVTDRSFSYYLHETS